MRYFVHPPATHKASSLDGLIDLDFLDESCLPGKILWQSHRGLNLNLSGREAPIIHWKSHNDLTCKVDQLTS